MFGGDFILLIFVAATGEEGHPALEIPTKKCRIIPKAFAIPKPTVVSVSVKRFEMCSILKDFYFWITDFSA